MIIKNEKIMKTVNDQKKKPHNVLTPDFREVGEITSIVAFFLGMAIIAASIILGKSYTFYISVLAFSIFMTFLWRKAPRPWIYLVSLAAATPIPLLRQQFASNLIFAAWFIVLNMRYLAKLPKWIYVLIGLAITGFFTSSINWLSGDVVRSLMRQGAFAYNFILAPLILLPMIYVRMSKSRDHTANLQGLLFCLIVPSTLILLAAKLFGTQTNEWEASLHVANGPEGYIQYQLGKVMVNFLRTEVGFILAALICASTAIVVSQVKTKYRLLAGACMASNAFLLLTTGSIGSIFACLCGLAAMFYAQFRTVNIPKVLASVAAVCCILLLTYSFAPPNIKSYMGKRYEHRVTNTDTDRFTLWNRAIDKILEHPEGVGFTISVGDKVKSFTHNDYLAYIASYGLIGGLAYIFLIIGLLISFFLGVKRTDDPSALAVHLAGQSVIVAFAINSMTDNIGINRWYFNVIWSLIWYSYFCSREAQTGPVREKIRSKTVVGGTVAPNKKPASDFS